MMRSEPTSQGQRPGMGGRGSGTARSEMTADAAATTSKMMRCGKKKKKGGGGGGGEVKEEQGCQASPEPFLNGDNECTW